PSSAYEPSLHPHSFPTRRSSDLDTDFIDPAKSATANVSPGSITNGVTPVISSGNTADDIRADIKALFGSFISANNAPTSGVWIIDRKSTRLNSSHVSSSYAVFCL